MKIRVIRCKNIHSLKGEHVIYFDRPPLADAGLFAITGPTGAGKSSILDVITLALFNKIPRFTESGKESVTRSEIEKAGSVITHFTDQAYAEVDYEANGVLYRSTWRIEKTRNGTYKDYEMSLATLPDETLLDLKKSQVPAKNEEILRLTYDQFIRSILLSQGQFARLLRSDEKERARLLENLTGTEIYRSIGKAVYAKCVAAEKEIEILQRDLGSIQLLSEETKEEMKARVLLLTHDVAKASKEVEEITKLLQKHAQLRSLARDKDQVQVQLQEAEVKVVSFSPKAERLKSHDELQPYAGQLTLWKAESERLASLVTAQHQTDVSLRAHSENLKQTLDCISALVRQDVNEADYNECLLRFAESVTLLDTQLEQIRSMGNEVADKIRKLLNQPTDPFFSELSAIPRTEEQIQFIRENMARIKEESNTSGLTDTDLFSEIEKRQEESPIFVARAQAARQREELDSERTTYVRQILVLEEEMPAARVAGEELQQQAAKVQQSIAQLKHEKEALLHAKELDSFRPLLEEGAPCPLCGSTDHPFAHQSFDNAYGQRSFALDMAEKELATLQKSLSDLETRTSVKEQQIKQKKELLAQCEKKLADLGQQWNALPTAEVAQKENAAFTEILRSLQREIQMRARATLLDQLHDHMTNVETLRSDYSRIHLKRTELYPGPDSKEIVNTLQNTMKEHLEQRNVTAEKKRHLEEQRVTASDKVADYHTSMSPALSALGFNSLEDASGALLPDAQYRAWKSEGESLQTQKRHFESQLTTLQGQFSHLQTELANEASNEQQLTEQLADNKSVIEKGNQMIGSLETDLANNDELIKKYQEQEREIYDKKKTVGPLVFLNKLIGDAEGNKFAKFAQNVSLQQLTFLANKRLATLTDRYRLVPTDIEADMRIADIYQGGTQRSVKTLSGGETFLVSLALALSLSDMASHNVKLESLFIDEGFGTLDNETLDSAIATLEKLQSDSQRTIGIISHVGSLKERISTKIKVERNAQGYATLTVE